MADRPCLRLDESTLCLHAETKASPLLGQPAPTFPSNISTTPTSTSTSSSGQVCYICHCEASEEPLISDVCGCKQRLVHPKCLATWLHYSAARRDNQHPPHCEVCLQTYRLPASVQINAVVRVPRGRQASSPVFASYSVPALLAFVYGFSFASLGDNMNSVLCTCVVGNTVVLMSWLLFVVSRQQVLQTAQHRAVEDSVVLLCAYIAFLCGWMLQEWSMPRYIKSGSFAITHVVNTAFVSASVLARLVYRPCKLCCLFTCLRPSATITLDLGD